jgi:hypothetical protein
VFRGISTDALIADSSSVSSSGMSLMKYALKNVSIVSPSVAVNVPSGLRRD